MGVRSFVHGWLLQAGAVVDADGAGRGDVAIPWCFECDAESDAEGHTREPWIVAFEHEC